MSKRILIVDDDEDVLSALDMLLTSENHLPVLVDSPEKALAAVRSQEFDLVMVDLNYSLDTTSGKEGIKLVSAIRRLDELVPVIVMTGWATVDVAIEAMKCGASDFIEKPWENDRLMAVVRNQVRFAAAQRRSERLVRHNKMLREEFNPVRDIVVQSESIKQVVNTIKQVAKKDVSVLFTGENGTGKSIFGHYLHQLSDRSKFAFVTVNMGAVSETLFESEMFGHVKGAFTDSASNRVGRFELADEGTLFLDEIANTPIDQQGKLLRVLENGQFEKVGSSITQSVNVRLITATNHDLELEVSEGRFRKDLLYRINAVQIEIPPLRERIEDIVPLANAFLIRSARKYSQQPLSISDTASKALEAYYWPGNVRELSHVMERAQILSQTGRIELQDLSLDRISSQRQATQVSEVLPLKSMDQIEAETLEARLRHFNGDAIKASASLGLSRSAFYRRLQKARN